MTRFVFGTRAGARPFAIRATSAACLFALTLGPAHALDIVFDYRFDRSGFFDTATVEGAQRRSVLEAAADAYDSFSDALAPISPGGGTDSWRVTFKHPSWTTFFEQTTVENLVVPANTMIIFVGSAFSASSVLGAAENGVIQVTGNAAFEATVRVRGQVGALDTVPTDFGPWGGSIWFNRAASWHIGLDTVGLDSTKADLLTTATHEIGHLLGIGEAPSWDAQIAGTSGDYRFTGDASQAAYGGDVPLDPIGAHWGEGVGSFVNGVPQETLMDPTTARGNRELLTTLDLAGLSDVGWQVRPVPEPSTVALGALGLMTLALHSRSRVRATTPSQS